MMSLITTTTTTTWHLYCAKTKNICTKAHEITQTMHEKYTNKFISEEFITTVTDHMRD